MTIRRVSALLACIGLVAALAAPGATARPLPPGNVVTCTVNWLNQGGGGSGDPPEPHTPMPYNCV